MHDMTDELPCFTLSRGEEELSARREIASQD